MRYLLCFLLLFFINPYSWAAYNPVQNPILEISKNKIEDHSIVFVVGQNLSLTTTEQTVWPLGGRYTPKFTTATCQLSSGSAADTSAGTGARTVLVNYLTTAYVAVNSEIISMNGQTAVNLASPCLAVNTLVILTSGSGMTNAARIYASNGSLTAGVPTVANTYNVMEIGEGAQSAAIFTVPAGFSIYLFGVTASVDPNKIVVGRFRLFSDNQTLTSGFPFHLTNIFSAFNIAVTPRLLEKTLIDHTGKAGTTAEIYSSFSYVMIDDSVADQAN